MTETIHPLAEPAMQACLNMNQSKQAHFEWLEALNQKQDLGLTISIAENQKLKSLLSTHDKNVSLFRDEMLALKQMDLSAYASLIEHMQLLAEQTLAS